MTVNTTGGIAFPHAAQAVRISRTRVIKGKTTRETAYLIVSLPAEDAQPPAAGLGSPRAAHREPAALRARRHLHEDAHQARTGNGPAIAAVLRNTAIGYHRINGEPNIARATRRTNRRPGDLVHAVTSTSNNATTQSPWVQRGVLTESELRVFVLV